MVLDFKFLEPSLLTIMGLIFILMKNSFKVLMKMLQDKAMLTSILQIYYPTEYIQLKLTQQVFLNCINLLTGLRSMVHD